MQRFLLPVLLFAAGASGAEPAGPSALLRNGSFRELTDTGGPAGWRIVEEGQKTVVDSAAGVLRVDIASARTSDGQIGQRVKGLRPERAYVVSAQLRSSKPGIAYLQVKRHRGGHELQRITAPQRSDTAWRDAEVTFPVGDADEVEVLCRFRQKDDTLGQTVWFRAVQLREADAPTLGGGEAVPTFHSIGVHLNYAGGLTDQSAGRVRYRAAGAPEWLDGLPLVPCGSERQLRGSLLALTPDTAYEIECRLTSPADDAGQPPAVVMLRARTWPEDVPVAEVRTLPAGTTNGMLRIAAQGKPDGWICYRPAPGGGATVDAGSGADYALLLENAAYVLVEELALRGGRRDAVRVAKSHDVRIRRCDIAGWGDPGTAQPGLPQGLYVDAAGRTINYQAGVRVCDGSARIVVERCFIHAPRGTANSWAHGHPAGPQGIILDRTGGNNVVRYNDIVGSETHWWNDAIESVSNGEVGGGPYRDTDIHGNVLAFSNDDGTELDGGQINVRYWHNWIAWALCGISCAPNRSGPSYVYRNLIAGLGDERESTGSAFKMGGAGLSPGLCVIAHNTVYGRGGGLRSVGYGSGADRGAYVAFSRNNLFAGPGGQDVVNISTDSRNDFDYDLTARGGVRLAGGGEAHAVTSAPSFVAASLGDYRLAAGSAGLDQGCRVPGLNHAFAGRAPDMGAFETDAAGPDFPPRPDGFTVLPLRATVALPPSRGRVAATFQVTVPAGLGATWTAYPNSAWLTCDPSCGPADGKPVIVRVGIGDDGRPRPRYRGAVTFRTDRGFARTVMLEAGDAPSGK